MWSVSGFGRVDCRPLSTCCYQPPSGSSSDLSGLVPLRLLLLLLLLLCRTLAAFTADHSWLLCYHGSLVMCAGFTLLCYWHADYTNTPYCSSVHRLFMAVSVRAATPGRYEFTRPHLMPPELTHEEKTAEPWGPKGSGSGSGMFYIRLRPSTAIGCGTKRECTT
jgi:hypothetical protein